MCGYKTGYFVLVVGKLKEREIREYCSLAGCGQVGSIRASSNAERPE